MNTEVPSGRLRHDKKNNKSSRRIPITALVTGLALLSPGLLHAADARSQADIQADIDRLKQLLEKDQQELAAQNGTGSPADAQSAETSQPAADASQGKAADVANLDTVQVRTRSRLESLKDVPASVSVVTGKELQQQAGYDLGAITKRTANVSRNTGNSRTYSLSIRGIGQVGQTEAQDPSVGVIVDGISYAYNPLASFDFYDVDKVEVARGPQGTQGGKNADIGVINVTTRRPSFTPGVDYSLVYGRDQTVTGQVAGGGPIIDDLLAWRGSLIADKGNGQIKNTYNPDQTFFNTDRVAGRAQFLLKPSDDFSALLSVEIQPTGSENYNSGTFFTPTPTTFSDGQKNPLSTDASTRLARSWFTQQGSYSYLTNYLSQTGVDVNNQQPLYTYTNGASTQLNWNLGNYALTSITGYRGYHFNARNDEGTPFNISLQGGGKVDEYKQLSQEFRLNSQIDGVVDYVVGLYLFKNGVDYSHGGWVSGWGSDAGAWFASNAQYAALDADGNGRYLLMNSLNGLNKSQPQSIRNHSEAIFANADWHLSDPLTLTTGLRFTQEGRRNQGSSYIADNGFAAELDPSVVNGVVLGGFDSYFNSSTTKSVSVLNGNVVPAGTPGATVVGPNVSGSSPYALTTDTTNAALLAQANAQANASALKYFNVSTWSGLSDSQKQQLYYAQAIRKGQIGVLWGNIQAQGFNKIQPTYVISPSYKINSNETAYISYQHGEKAGISQVVNGESALAQPEKNNSYEVGLKSRLFDRTLLLNADVFLNNISNYQQAVLVYDSYTSTLKSDGTSYYVSATGNVPKVQVKGLEIDGAYSGIPHTLVRFSGAYNDAIFKSFPNSGQPVEYDTVATSTYTPTPYRDVSGQNLPGAAKYTFNIGTEYRYPVFKDAAEFHSSFNTNYTSRYNSDVALSSYAWVHAHSVTDFAIGLGRSDQRFDASIVVKNLFDDRTPQALTWNSYTPAVYRWYGVMFVGKL